MYIYILLLLLECRYTTQKREWADFIVAQAMRMALDDLINGKVDPDAYVDLMLVGHQHSYERSCPVYSNECVANGRATVHVCVGTAGANLEHGGFSHFYKFSTVHEEDSHGLLTLNATQQHIHVRFVRNNLTVFDDFKVLPWK